MYIVFDQYTKYSIKFHEHQWRAMGAMPHDYVLTGNTKLPAREEIMKSDNSKEALIQYIIMQCSQYQSSSTLDQWQ